MLANGDVAAAETGERGRERCISGFKIRKSAYDTTYESGERRKGGRCEVVVEVELGDHQAGHRNCSKYVNLWPGKLQVGGVRWKENGRRNCSVSLSEAATWRRFAGRNSRAHIAEPTETLLRLN